MNTQATDKTAPMLVLASASPRRRQLLSEMSVEFQAVESGFQESMIAGEEAGPFALRMACGKAAAVSAGRPEALVLGADTVVEIDRTILGKPRSQGEAMEMLKRLSGRCHRVITGFALARGGEVIESAAVESRVHFHPLSAEEIQAYTGSEEPYDKAGAYAIQGRGAAFIRAVEGSHSNVMGLPVDEVRAALRRHGAGRGSEHS